MTAVPARTPFEYAGPAVTAGRPTATIAKVAIWSAILVPGLGFLFGVIGICKLDEDGPRGGQRLCFVSVFVSLFLWLVVAAVLTAVVSVHGGHLDFAPDSSSR